MATDIAERPVVYFDGVCNLCNGAVQFIIRHDKKKQFLFASLQAPAGEQARQEMTGRNIKVPDSIILRHHGTYYTEAAAIFRIADLLGGYLKLLSVGRLFPSSLQNAVYRLVARNRHKWFGTRQECMIPTPELKSRFL